jgi:hypothetical protein
MLHNLEMQVGGGGTDIRIGTNDLYHRVIVAGRRSAEAELLAAV